MSSKGPCFKIILMVNPNELQIHTIIIQIPDMYVLANVRM